MAFVGEFHMEKKNGKPFQFVYHQPKYQSRYGHNRQPLFLCPYARSVPSLRGFSDPDRPFHPRRTTLRRINKEIDVDGDCHACSDSNSGTTYYFCDDCDKAFHKECVEAPPMIKNPYHPDHHLQRSIFVFTPNIQCLYCGKKAKYWIYCCKICKVFMHPTCAMKPKPISFVIDQPKRHDHPLTLFPRQSVLICNICGLLRNRSLTYICVECDFIAHEDCMHLPRIIKISRHNHRISHVSFLGSGKWSCGVCRKSINSDYGAYSCDKCSDYVVHSRCATSKNVWDGEDLEGVPEKGDITQDVEPFKMIVEGVILHFLHDHHLQLEVNLIYNENKLCQGCVLPIFEGNFYSCVECEFVLHKTCAEAPSIIQHVLHPHPLKFVNRYTSGAFRCNACWRICGGFVYQCPIKECKFNLDVRCASISEPFDYQCHEHPLFLSKDPEEKPRCVLCKSECSRKPLNCIKCDFIVCMECATLPYKARYKHDKHFLTISWGKEVCEKDWCEMCERNLGDTRTKLFYRCKDCCTALHIACLFGQDPYMKPGQFFNTQRGNTIQVLGTNNLSRPFICDRCKNPSQGKRVTITSDNRTACSTKCAFDFEYGV